VQFIRVGIGVVVMDRLFAKLAVLGRTSASLFILLKNVGPKGAFVLLLSSRLSSKLTAINIRSMKRTLWFRGGTDRKTLHVLYSPTYQIVDNEENPVRVVVDGGANIGDQTIRFRHFYRHARIVAVEPDAGNFSILERNFLDDRNTEVLNAAIWYKDGTVNLKTGVDSVSHSVSNGGGSTRSVTVPFLLKKYNLPKIDILKLDVEGAEIEIFNSADSWASKVNAIIVEPHDRIRDGCGFAIIRPFLDLGFNLFVSGENLILIRRGLGWRVQETLYY
jgi:FkbM family methyltransferase